MAMLLGFSSNVLQSSQSRNFEAFLAGTHTNRADSTYTRRSEEEKGTSELALSLWYHFEMLTKKTNIYKYMIHFCIFFWINDKLMIFCFAI